jgi:hypothetical protein
VLELTQAAEQSSPRSRADTLVPLLIVAAYLAVELYFFSIHEPWHDEAQAWLKAKELIGWQFLAIPGEGHPPVWYWLLRGLSHVISFDQARLLMLGVAAINAWMLARLFGERPILLFMLFASLPLLHAWGFHFRPYPLILTCVLVALLADRAGRPMIATWVLALSCGLSFLSGWLLAFWLLVQLHRRAPVSSLVAPAIVAALFAVSAILSSSGNVDMGPQRESLVTALFDVLALPFAIPAFNSIVIVAIAAAIIGYGLWRFPFVLGSIATLWLLLGIFGAFFYGLREWHAAFGLMLVLMAFSVTKAPIWPLLLLLLAQDYWGIKKSVQEIRFPSAADGPAYEAILTDAGARLDTERNLVSWPDHIMTPSAARRGFRFVSGNNGHVVAAIDLTSRKHGDMSHKVFAETPGPYWLVCFQCEDPLAIVRSTGRQITELMPRTEAIAGAVAAYRID